MRGNKGLQGTLFEAPRRDIPFQNRHTHNRNTSQCRHTTKIHNMGTREENTTGQCFAGHCLNFVRLSYILESQWDPKRISTLILGRPLVPFPQILQCYSKERGENLRWKPLPKGTLGGRGRVKGAEDLDSSWPKGRRIYYVLL